MLRITFWTLTILSAFIFLAHLWQIAHAPTGTLLSFLFLLSGIVIIHAIRMLVLLSLLKATGISCRFEVSSEINRGIDIIYDARSNWLFTLMASVTIFVLLFAASACVYWISPALRFAVSGAFLSYLLFVQPTSKSFSWLLKYKKNKPLLPSFQNSYSLKNSVE